MELHSYTPLACRVLVVLVTRVDGWCAYIDAVPGDCHQNEALGVMRSGVKLREETALTIFPFMADKEMPYAH